MHMALTAEDSRRRALVTGGGGYLGSRLCRELVDVGYEVTAFDVCFRDDTGPADEIRKLKGDVCDSGAVVSAISSSQADVVFHLASFGMSGREMMERKKIEAVNIGGTHNIIDGCVECGVTRLVYTSTYNVVFGGQEIKNGDESLPYLPTDKHVDHYSRTKSVADQAVLEANGRELKRSGCLTTCALRCAGIYGEGEQRHFPRIVGYIERGLFSFTYGAKDNMVDFLHADNFVQAHIKAAEALLSPQSPAAGKPYFISDGKPVNNFLFFKQLVEGLGYTYPKLRVPLFIMFYLAYLIECVHSFVSPVYNFQPLLTRAEVFKTGVTHYFNIAAARRDLGYDPQPRDLSGTVKWFKARGHGKKVKHRTLSRWIVPVILLAVVWALLLGTLPVVY